MFIINDIRCFKNIFPFAFIRLIDAIQDKDKNININKISSYLNNRGTELDIKNIVQYNKAYNALNSEIQKSLEKINIQNEDDVKKICDQLDGKTIINNKLQDNSNNKEQKSKNNHIVKDKKKNINDNKNAKSKNNTNIIITEEKNKRMQMKPISKIFNNELETNTKNKNNVNLKINSTEEIRRKTEQKSNDNKIQISEDENMLPSNNKASHYLCPCCNCKCWPFN